MPKETIQGSVGVSELIELLEDVTPWLGRALGDAPLWGRSAASVMTRLQDTIKTLKQGVPAVD